VSAGTERCGRAASLRAIVARIVAADADERRDILKGLPEAVLRGLIEDWEGWAHAGQTPGGDDWSIWLIRAGRGFGKTRAGAEWVQAYARANVTAQIALVGATLDDARQVMVEGPSGLIATCRDGETWAWRRDRGEFRFASGAVGFVYSAETPDKLRGPEHDAAWCDELAKWRYGEAAWDNLRMGLRLGDRPRIVVTTTPRPTMLMRKVMALPETVETRGGTAANPHLAAGFAAAMAREYGGTRLGRQELEGELVDDLDQALWSRALVERQRRAAPALVRVVVGVDPPAGVEGDACGIVAVGIGADGDAYVLEDASVAGLTPDGWASAVAECAGRHGADRVVAEANQGGAMVETVLRGAERELPLRLVHASRSKGARAEPVSALYERGRVWHAAPCPALEDELCGLTPLGYEGPGRSPDRADALVWAVWFLLLQPGRAGEVRVRAVE